MNDILTCTLSSAVEREQILSALRQAGIPIEHVSETIAGSPAGAQGQSAGDANFTDWPLADGVLCGCIGGAFGAYVGLFSRFIPDLDPLNAIGPSWIIIGSAAFGTAFGVITALIIKAFWPHHEAQQKTPAPSTGSRILIVHPEDPHEAQLAQEILIGTGHAQGLRIIHMGPA